MKYDILVKWFPIFDSFSFDRSRYLVLAQYCELFSINEHSNNQYFTTGLLSLVNILPFCLKVLGNIVGESSQIIFINSLVSVKRDIELGKILEEDSSFEIKDERLSIKITGPIDLHGTDIVSHYESLLNSLVQNRIDEIIRVDGQFVFTHDFLRNLEILPSEIKIDLKYIKVKNQKYGQYNY